MKILQKKESELISCLCNSFLTIISHDAGGANVLHSFLQAHNLIPNLLLTSGPATQIFESLQIDKAKNLNSETEVVLASTGWQTDFEIRHISNAIDSGKRVIVFLDHWTNYSSRLKFNSDIVPISEIVTFDLKAKSLASDIFINSSIYCFENYYLQEQAVLVANLRKKSSEYLYDFLFIGEPIRNQGYTEEDALNYFISKVKHSGLISPAIAIRPHPSQSREKYMRMLLNFEEYLIHVTENTSLHDDLSNSKAVIGCNSMALELSKLCKIPTYSAVPEPFYSSLPIDSFLKWGN